MEISDVRNIIRFINKNIVDVKASVDDTLTIVEMFRPEFEQLGKIFADTMVDSKAYAINRYINVHQFSREEAFQLVMNQDQQLTSALAKKSLKK